MHIKNLQALLGYPYQQKVAVKAVVVALNSFIAGMPRDIILEPGEVPRPLPKRAKGAGGNFPTLNLRDLCIRDGLAPPAHLKDARAFLAKAGCSHSWGKASLDSTLAAAASMAWLISHGSVAKNLER